jgi:sec-independent protein translocase protein TatB
MLDFGFSEILLTSAIALVVLGPERLPKVARQVGNWMGRARSMARQLSEQLEREVSADDLLKEQSKTRAPMGNRSAPPSLMQPLAPSPSDMPGTDMPQEKLTGTSPGVPSAVPHETPQSMSPETPSGMAHESLPEIPPGAPPSMQRDWPRAMPLMTPPPETANGVASGVPHESAKQPPPRTPTPPSSPDAQARHPPNE